MENNEKSLAVIDHPEIMTSDRAKTIAHELIKIVKELDWAKKFGGEKEHLEIDAWQFIAAKDGATPTILETHEIIDKDGNFLGFRAVAGLMRDGECLTRAEHECTMHENNWRTKPRYSLFGMAQTRAMSRVCRNRYSWIARMGGFSGTPADEMEADFNKKKKYGQKPQKTSEAEKNVWKPFRAKVKERYGDLNENQQQSMNEFIKKMAEERGDKNWEYILSIMDNTDKFFDDWEAWDKA